MRAIAVAITGATGAIYGIRLLEWARELGVETHLVISEWGRRTMRLETDRHPDEVRGLATVCYDEHELSAPLTDRTSPAEALVVAPCSMRTLAAVAHRSGENLIQRAADAMLDFGRPVVLVVRESPLSPIHLDNMLRVARRGAIVAPPAPALYVRPQSIDQLVDHTVGRLFDVLGVDHERIRRWGPSR